MFPGKQITNNAQLSARNTNNNLNSSIGYCQLNIEFVCCISMLHECI